jgi:hypothetical protein
MSLTQRALQAGSSRFSGYAADPQPPLRDYAAATTVYVTSLGGALALVLARGHELPERIGFGDLVLLGVATHKLSRLIAKDKVTSFVRAPFTRLQGPAGQGELSEEPRGEGLQLLLGELIVCPYCLGQWVAGVGVVSLLAAPRLTRLLASIFAVHAASDFLQLGYLLTKQETSS